MIMLSPLEYEKLVKAPPRGGKRISVQVSLHLFLKVQLWWNFELEVGRRDKVGRWLQLILDEVVVSKASVTLEIRTPWRRELL